MATYYIDAVNGDDSLDGLFQTTEGPGEGPWKTWYNISGANTSGSISSGDTVLFKRGETFKRSIVVADYPAVEGNGCWRPSNVSNILFGAYGAGAKPIIDLDSDVAYDSTYVGYNLAMTNTTFENLNFINSVGRNDLAGHLLTAHNTCNHITISYCDFDARNESGLGNSSTKNETFAMSCDDITIDHCTAIGEYPYNRHAFYIGGANSRITNNYAKGFGLSGLKFNTGSTDGIISHNTIIDAAVAIDVGYCANADIFSNVIIQTAVYTSSSARAIQLESNSSDTQIPTDNKIFNNTIVMNIGDGISYTLSAYKNDGDWGADMTNEYANNIVYLYNGSGDQFHWMYGTTGSQPQFTNPIPSDHQIYHSVDGASNWKVQPTIYSTLASWRNVPGAPVGFEVNSIEGDPLFDNHSLNNEDPLAYRILVGSPAIGGGKAVTPNNLLWSEVTDFEGTLFSTNDIGAFAYIAASGTDPVITVDTYPRATLVIEASDPESYQWYKDDVVISGATLASYLTPQLLSGHDSEYFCRVSGNNTYVDSQSVRVSMDVDCVGISYQMIL